MSYTPYSEFAEMDFSGDDVLTADMTLHEMRKLFTESAYVEGYATGVLNTIAELRESGVPEDTISEILESRMRHLFDKETDKKGNDNA